MLVHNVNTLLTLFIPLLLYRNYQKMTVLLQYHRRTCNTKENRQWTGTKVIILCFGDVNVNIVISLVELLGYVFCNV